MDSGPVKLVGNKRSLASPRSYRLDVRFEGQTAYGRRTCKRMAKRAPEQALMNADTHAYFISDVNAVEEVR